MMAVRIARNGGFTLVEMVLVVGILALLAVFAATRLAGLSESARATAAANSLLYRPYTPDRKFISVPLFLCASILCRQSGFVFAQR